jgi:acyl-CoA thioesterase I
MHIHAAVLTAIALAGSLCLTSIPAQEASPTLPETKAPAPAKASAPHTGEYWTKHDHGLLVDFGDLDHFKDADAALGPPAPGQDRVVFLGDSITQGWKLAESFPGKPYINRGISGETTPQMLVRFRQDVIGLHPRAVVILAGTNDVAGNTGPMTPDQTEGNLASMAELAAANGIRVVLCSVLPARDFPWNPGQEPAPKIAALNDWIKTYASQKGYVYVDYYSAMADAQGGLPPTLSRDGVHPLPAGYAAMAPLVETGIEKALKNGD